jgi:capsular polysaccharide transport system permease protein
MSDPSNPNSRAVAALDRARRLSASLAEAARMARVAGRGRSQYSGGGFGARKGADAMRIFVALSFALCVVVPVLVSTFYFTFWASDQYVAQARFTVTNSMIPKLDGLAEVTGLAQASIVRDTQIVTNYLQSRAAVEKLDAKVGLRAAYSRAEIDYFSRFDPAKPIEKFVRYWEKMSSTSILMPGGIVDLRVYAYTPEDAKVIADAVVEMSEDLINELNQRINKDAMTNAQVEVKRAAERLTQARLTLEKVRNEEKILDATKAGESINTLITEARGVQMQLQREYSATSRVVSTSTPQLRLLKERLEGLSGQIAEMEGKLTERSGGGAPSIAQSITRFSELELERQIAERIYGGAVAALEVARVVAEQRQVYINTFVKPSTPSDAQYPRRFLMCFLIALAALSLWGALIGAIVLMRNHMA